MSSRRLSRASSIAVGDECRCARRSILAGEPNCSRSNGDAALFVGDRGQCVRSAGHAAKALGQLLCFVTVAHPHLNRFRQAGKQLCRAVFNIDLGMSIFALERRAHPSAQVVHNEVQPVADAEGGHAERENSWVGGRGVRVVNRRRTAGKNQSDGFVGLNLPQGRRARQHYRENVLFADAARDELRILRAEIEDNDGLSVHAPVWQGGRRDVKIGKVGRIRRLFVVIPRL